MEVGHDQYLLAGELSEILQINDTEIARLARRGILPVT
jgi:hypothetical protein